MSSSWRKATLKDWCPERSTGVWRIPLRPNLLRRREAIDSLKSSSECLFPVSTPLTSTCSHSMGTLSALKIVFTDSATSAPIPSPRREESNQSRDLLSISVCDLSIPGIKVTVYLPPYFVGLKMSD